MEKDFKNIVIRMPNWIGDLVMATPILFDVRQRFKNSKITVVCNEKIAGILEGDENIDGIIYFKKTKKREAVKRLRAEKFDLGILLTNSFSSAFLFFKGNVKNILGYRGNWRSFFLKKGVKRFKGKEHLVVTYKRLLKDLGIKVSKTFPKLFLKKEDRALAKKILLQSGFIPSKKLVGINPLASYGPAKCWLLKRFREISKKLLEDKNLFILFIGEEKDFLEIKNLLKDLGKRAINLAGRTTAGELVAIINECDLFLTNDSGPMHIAAALDVEVVSIFGSTDDEVTGPYMKGGVINKRVFCSPCFKRVCSGDFRCMKSIEVEDVLEEVKSKLYAKGN
jgi:heptosyltransferase-2